MFVLADAQTDRQTDRQHFLGNKSILGPTTNMHAQHNETHSDLNYNDLQGIFILRFV